MGREGVHTLKSIPAGDAASLLNTLGHQVSSGLCLALGSGHNLPTPGSIQSAAPLHSNHLLTWDQAQVDQAQTTRIFMDRYKGRGWSISGRLTPGLPAIMGRELLHACSLGMEWVMSVL